MENRYAPIVLFVYNRLDHTKKTINTLQKNTLASESELFIYSDAAKNQVDQKSVHEVRKFIKSITGFKKVYIIEQEINLGLAKSIITGVTKTINHYGKVIVMEDDIVTSPHFLQFMNKSLEKYESFKDVWHVSGWSYPIDTSKLDDIYFIRIMNCWGWATWSDRWNSFEKNPQALLSEFNKDDIYNFDIENSKYFWPQVIANLKGNINTWAIFWYATIFKNKGLCLAPTLTYVNNIGLDGSGVHCEADSTLENLKLNHNDRIVFSDSIIESKVAYERIRQFFKSQKKPLLIRLKNKVKKFFYRF